MATAEILNITEVPIVDESIEKFEHHEYEPITGTSINNQGEIRINIEQQDLFFHLSEAFLFFEGRLTKADNTAYANDDAVALTNNGLMYLFNQISYQLSNQDIEKVFHPGQATTILGLLKYPEDFSRAQGRVCFLQTRKLQLFKTIESKATVPATYRARQCDTIVVPQSTTFSWRLSVKTSPEKPRYIIVAFQTAKSGNQEANPAIFNHCDLKNMYIMLNQAVDYNLSFPNQQFSRAYYEASKFSEKFYGMNDLITHSNITPADFKDPLMVFDVSKQSERLKWFL